MNVLLPATLCEAWAQPWFHHSDQFRIKYCISFQMLSTFSVFFSIIFSPKFLLGLAPSFIHGISALAYLSLTVVIYLLVLVPKLPLVSDDILQELTGLFFLLWPHTARVNGAILSVTARVIWTILSSLMTYCNGYLSYSFFRSMAQAPSTHTQWKIVWSSMVWQNLFLCLWNQRCVHNFSFFFKKKPYLFSSVLLHHLMGSNWF